MYSSIRGLMPRPVGGVALRVQIDHEHPVVQLGERRSQVDRRRGLAHAALLVGHRHDARKGPLRHRGRVILRLADWCRLRDLGPADAVIDRSRLAAVGMVGLGSDRRRLARSRFLPALPLQEFPVPMSRTRLIRTTDRRRIGAPTRRKVGRHSSVLPEQNVHTPRWRGPILHLPALGVKHSTRIPPARLPPVPRPTGHDICAVLFHVEQRRASSPSSTTAARTRLGINGTAGPPAGPVALEHPTLPAPPCGRSRPTTRAARLSCCPRVLAGDHICAVRSDRDPPAPTREMELTPAQAPAVLTADRESFRPGPVARVAHPLGVRAVAAPPARPLHTRPHRTGARRLCRSATRGRSSRNTGSPMFHVERRRPCGPFPDRRGSAAISWRDRLSEESDLIEQPRARKADLEVWSAHAADSPASPRTRPCSGRHRCGVRTTAIIEPSQRWPVVLEERAFRRHAGATGVAGVGRSH